MQQCHFRHNGEVAAGGWVAWQVALALVWMGPAGLGFWGKSMIDPLPSHGMKKHNILIETMVQLVDSIAQDV